MHEICREDADHDLNLYWGVNYRTLVCRGCDAVTFQEELWSNEERNPYTGEYEMTSRLYPPRIPGVRAIDGEDVWHWLPFNLKNMHDEVTRAIQMQAVTLAVVGMRALVEGVCVHQKATGRTFEQKIDSLIAKQVLPVTHRAVVLLLRDYGNRAAHELSRPTQEEVVTLFGLVTQLLRTTYEMPHAAARLTRDRTPSVPTIVP